MADNRHLKQMVALIQPEIRDGVEMLWLISGQSRARVLEDLLGQQVRERLADMDLVVERVKRLAGAAGVDAATYVEAYAAAYGRKTYRPDVEALEADDSAVRERLPKGAAAAPAFSG